MKVQAGDTVILRNGRAVRILRDMSVPVRNVGRVIRRGIELYPILDRRGNWTLASVPEDAK